MKVFINGRQLTLDSQALQELTNSNTKLTTTNTNLTNNINQLITVNTNLSSLLSKKLDQDDKPHMSLPYDFLPLLVPTGADIADASEGTFALTEENWGIGKDFYPVNFYFKATVSSDDFGRYFGSYIKISININGNERIVEKVFTEQELFYSYDKDNTLINFLIPFDIVRINSEDTINISIYNNSGVLLVSPSGYLLGIWTGLAGQTSSQLLSNGFEGVPSNWLNTPPAQSIDGWYLAGSANRAWGNMGEEFFGSGTNVQPKTGSNFFSTSFGSDADDYCIYRSLSQATKKFSLKFTICYWNYDDQSSDTTPVHLALSDANVENGIYSDKGISYSPTDFINLQIDVMWWNDLVNPPSMQFDFYLYTRYNSGNIVSRFSYTHNYVLPTTTSAVRYYNIKLDIDEVICKLYIDDNNDGSYDLLKTAPVSLWISKPIQTFQILPILTVGANNNELAVDDIVVDSLV